MTCDTGLRKEFADDLVANVSELAKKYGLDDVVVHRQADPVLVAARGCLRASKKDKGERIELVLQISPDIARADVMSIEGAELSPAATLDAARAFDLSEAVARDTVAFAAEPEPDDGCDPDRGSNTVR